MDLDTTSSLLLLKNTADDCLYLLQLDTSFLRISSESERRGVFLCKDEVAGLRNGLVGGRIYSPVSDERCFKEPRRGSAAAPLTALVPRTSHHKQKSHPETN